MAGKKPAEVQFMPENRREHWEGVHEKGGEAKVSWFQEYPEPSLRLILKNRHAAGRGIIDIGAGASRLADALIAAGCGDITLLDISSRALRKTAERLGDKASHIEFITADITNWHADRKWGIWHDRAVFHFLTEAKDQDSYISSMKAATEAGSIAVMGTFSPQGPERCSGLPVQRYSAENLLARLGSAFEPVEALSHDHVTPAGAVQNFMFAVLRRR